jgi:hypothetical protein
VVEALRLFLLPALEALRLFLLPRVVAMVECSKPTREANKAGQNVPLW